MTENSANKDMNKYLFVNLVTMLSMSAMQQLGKLVNPAAGKAEVNLDAARSTIDTLDMLAAKTKGNLDNDEARMMNDTLSMLKMNFVETKEEGAKAQRHKGPGSAEASTKEETEAQKEKPQEQTTPEEPKDTTPKSESPAQEPEGQKGAEPKNDKEEPKFHKSYS